ncbi:MAG: porin family protein [Bdellovibrionaceae bacterium]|nr:porin family protein [Pseudobdellovibrionaceae bacterium]MBX3032541.1 porin family protein [Pseudobdellovibrionaceae bacterium]
MVTAAAAVLTLAAASAYAAPSRGRGIASSLSGSSSMSFGLALITADQKDLNSVIDHYGGTNPGLKNIGSGLEVFAEYAFRFDRSIYGLVFRPSYFMQSTDGKCGSGSCEYKLNGLTFFPMLRLTPLENDFIKFYMQAGVGYGNLKASVKQDSASGDFSGSAFGGMAGIGVNFCFTESHCMTIEGNVRYLPIERNTSDGVSGTFDPNTSGFSQFERGREVEYNGNDLSTTLSGIQGVLAYTMNF